MKTAVEFTDLLMNEIRCDIQEKNYDALFGYFRGLFQEAIDQLPLERNDNEDSK